MGVCWPLGVRARCGHMCVRGRAGDPARGAPRRGSARSSCGLARNKGGRRLRDLDCAVLVMITSGLAQGHGPPRF